MDYSTWTPIELEIRKEMVTKNIKFLHFFDEIYLAYQEICKCFDNGGFLFVCGNGGSNCDALHAVGELGKSFEKYRPIGCDVDKLVSLPYGYELYNKLESGFRAITLGSDTGLSTAISNDIGSEYVFAQQLNSLITDSRDVLLTISTSGNSKNCLLAGTVAKAHNCKWISLTGNLNSEMNKHSDICIKSCEEKTANIQEDHIIIIHTLCRLIESLYFLDSMDKK